MAAFTKKVSAPELRKSNDMINTPVHYPFWFGGSASCFATFFTHPLDLGKLVLVLWEALANNCAVKVLLNVDAAAP